MVYLNKKNMTLILSFGIIVIFLVTLFILNKNTGEWKDEEVIPIKINEIEIMAEVASSIIKKSDGLSGRESMDENKGMLFIFDSPQPLSFWMKGMNFPLDFIWINGNRVVDLTENVPADNGATSIKPKVPADKVLEVNSGIIKRSGIKEGDVIKIANRRLSKDN